MFFVQEFKIDVDCHTPLYDTFAQSSQKLVEDCQNHPEETTNHDIIESDFDNLKLRWRRLSVVMEETEEKISKLHEVLPVYFITANNCNDELDAVERSLKVAPSFGVDVAAAENELERIVVS